MRRSPAASILPHLSSLMALAAVSALLVACAQAPATTDFGDSDATSAAQSQAQVVTPSGPTLGTVSVWLKEHGILLWTPAVGVAGTYEFELENIGDQAHDFVIARTSRIEGIPTRSDRAILHDVEVIARSPVLQPEQTTTLLANLDRSGSYVVLSNQDRDFGRGMASIFTVGEAPSSRVDPLPTPPPDDSETIAVFMVDGAIFLHRPTANAGIVTFNVQNIGPSPHDLVIVQWRGDPAALPVDAAGEVLLDGLSILGRLPPVPGGEAAMLEVELDGDVAYVLLSSLPGDYDAGMNAQVLLR